MQILFISFKILLISLQLLAIFDMKTVGKILKEFLTQKKKRKCTFLGEKVNVRTSYFYKKDKTFQLIGLDTPHILLAVAALFCDPQVVGFVSDICFVFSAETNQESREPLRERRRRSNSEGRSSSTQTTTLGLIFSIAKQKWGRTNTINQCTWNM